MAIEIKYNSEIQQVREQLSEQLAQEVTHAGKTQVLLLLSGGSCLTILPLLLQHLYSSPSDLSLMTIGMVDERFDEKESNFVHLKRDYGEFYKKMTDRGVNFFDTSPEGHKDQYELADWYDENLSAICHQLSAKGGKIITLLGMGKDGHIAGILPYPDEKEKEFYRQFVNTNRYVVGYNATEKNQFPKRFTLTFPALLKINHVFAFITGIEKKEALGMALSQDPPLHRCPAGYFRTTQQEVQIFTNIH